MCMHMLLAVQEYMVDKNQHVELRQLLELIMLHMQVATCCRYHALEYAQTTVL